MELLFHFTWSWMSHDDTVCLCMAFPVMSCYGKCRHQALSLSKLDIKNLTTTLDFSLSPRSPDDDRVETLGKLAILCDFDIGILIRSLNKNYTGDWTDFDAVEDLIQEMETVPHVPGLPVQEFDQVRNTIHHGFPFKKEFSCPLRDVRLRNLYDNHTSIDDHEPLLLEKLAEDVQKSFALAFPRWIFRFIYGLHLNSMGINIREVNGKLKYRLLNDPSTLVLGPSDEGALNDQLNKRDTSEVPTVFIGNCNDRIWTRIYNLRVANPTLRIIIYKDDLVKAFRRIRYHPDIANAYAYVFRNYLVVPIGAIFGGRDSPGYFCMVSELRSLASTHLSSLANASHPISDSVQFTALPSGLPCTAIKDSINTGLHSKEKGSQPVFVDDTIIVEYDQLIREAAASSILSANIIFGTPPAVEDPVSKEKFMPFFSHYCETLGLDIDTHLMLVIYPKDKRADLLHKVSQHVWKKGTRTPVKLLAVILGKIRHASQVVPCGEFISFFLQECLNIHVKQFGNKKAWSKYRQVFINSSAAFALNLLKSLLLCESLHVWSRPIGLLVKRDPTFVQLTDASTKGLGGVCFDALNFQWRCPSSLFTLDRDPCSYETFAEHDPNPHINILEFIAIIIHVYFAILRMKEKSIKEKFLTPNGYILSCLADNTSALSWMCHASRSRSFPIRNLAQFFVTLLFHANYLFPLDCQGDHIPGLENVHSDALSRPKMCPSYNDVFNKFECMRNVPRYHVPRKLIAILNSCLSHQPMPAPSEKEMKELLAPHLSSFKSFADPKTLMI